jgi:hypothetical protein
VSPGMNGMYDFESFGTTYEYTAPDRATAWKPTSSSRQLPAIARARHFLSPSLA